MSVGIKPKAIVVINPGNPTGQVLDRQSLEAVVNFAYSKKIVVIADEVYQDNIYGEHKQFTSIRKVINQMPSPKNKLEVFSFHSVSKGLLGECGFRGGYMQIANLSPKSRQQLRKLSIIHLVPNNIGQCSVDLMCNPPNSHNASQETIDSYHKERSLILSDMKQRALLVQEKLNGMTNVQCQSIEGAIYAFPEIKFSSKFIQRAKKQSMQPDMLYCIELLEKTGIMLVPGKKRLRSPTIRCLPLQSRAPDFRQKSEPDFANYSSPRPA